MDNGDLSPEMRRRLREKIAESLGIHVDNVPHDFESEEFNRLGADSLDLVEIVMEIEEELDSDQDTSARADLIDMQDLAKDTDAAASGPITIRATVWFVASFAFSAFAVLVYASGGGVSLVMIGESAASLRPGAMLTPISAALTYMFIRLVLPDKMFGARPATASIAGCVSFLLVAVPYDLIIVPHLAAIAGKTEFERDTWFTFHLAMTGCVAIGTAAEYMFVKFPLAGSGE